MRLLLLLKQAVLLAGASTATQADILLSDAEIAQTLQHGPWPQVAQTDPSNRFSGNPNAIALGQTLFHETSLSLSGDLSCATCHQPEQDFTDGRARGLGKALLKRNTQSLWNMDQFRWFGWSGDTDSLWAQSITPLFHSDEMAHSPQSLHGLMLGHATREQIETLTGPLDTVSPEENAANLGKIIAAYVETQRSGQTSFDRFRDALAVDDLATAANYPKDAQRGLQLFLGEGRCSFCHSGPNFSNSEFHDAGVPYFLAEGGVDEGRHAGILALQSSPFTLNSAYSDDPEKTGAWAVRNVRFNHANFGMFRVPSLRRVMHTAPYMHDGSLPDIAAVLDHYNTIDMERLHSDGEAILRPLNMSQDQLDDLAAFLATLSDDG